MLKQAQIDAIREHVALDARTRELIRLARWDLYNGPGANDGEDYPGFEASCTLISKALPDSDLYIDVEIDEVIGEDEPHWHQEGCGCGEDDETVGYYREHVICVDVRDVKRALVGRELAEYV